MGTTKNEANTPEPSSNEPKQFSEPFSEEEKREILEQVARALGVNPPANPNLSWNNTRNKG